MYSWGRLTWQNKTELDVNKWSIDYAPLTAIMYKPSHNNTQHKYSKYKSSDQHCIKSSNQVFKSKPRRTLTIAPYVAFVGKNTMFNGLKSQPFNRHLTAHKQS